MKFIFFTLLPFCTTALAQTEVSADETPVQTPERRTDTLGDATSLTAGTVKVNFPLRYSWGSFGFTKSGKKFDNGMKTSSLTSEVRAEYGVNDELTLYLSAPFVLSNKASMQAETFRKSESYVAQQNMLISSFGANLQSQKLCADATTCTELIESGYAFPSDTNVTLFSGETISFKSGVPLVQYADSIVLNSMKPQSGETGFGDLEVGTFYSLYSNEEFQLGAGVGLRLPTGKFENVAGGKRATGFGTTDLRFRLNLDYIGTQSVVLSLQNISDVTVVDGKKKLPSLLDPNKLSSSTEAQTFERDGLRQVGSLKLTFEPSAYSDQLKFLSIFASTNYDFRPEEKLGDFLWNKENSLISAKVGTQFDGMQLNFPMQLTFSYEQPLTGKNILVAENHFLVEIAGVF